MQGLMGLRYLKKFRRKYNRRTGFAPAEHAELTKAVKAESDPNGLEDQSFHEDKSQENNFEAQSVPLPTPDSQAGTDSIPDGSQGSGS